MAYRNYEYPKVMDQLALTHGGGPFFEAAPPPFDVRSEFAAWIQHGVEIAKAVHTEKARSEFILAPILLELRRALSGQFSLFSGEELKGGQRGLKGTCDFMLRKDESETVREAPILAVLEAKNDPSPREYGSYPNGLGQCIAAMVAARNFNRKNNWHTKLPRVFGALTTGTLWKFLYLEGNTLAIGPDYNLEMPHPNTCGNVDNLPTIMGILQRIVQYPWV